jgi:hypothetical protein
MMKTVSAPKPVETGSSLQQQNHVYKKLFQSMEFRFAPTDGN